MMFVLRITNVIAAILVCASVSNAALVNKYTFNDGTANDSVGSDHGTLVDPSGIGFFAGGQVHLTNNNGATSNQDFSLPSTVGAFVNLPNGIINNAANGGDFYEFSLEFWATVEENRDWARLGDFGISNQGEDISGSADMTDYLIVAPYTGVVEDVDAGVTPAANYFAASTHSSTGFEDFVADPNGPLSTGVEHHIVVTVDQNDTTEGNNGTLNLYLNNVLVDTGPVDDEGNIDFTFINDVNNWLGRSQWGDFLFDGSYNEFRIYDHALDASEVSSSNATGPEAGALAVPTLLVNRDTGEITIVGDSAEQLTIDEFTITSAAGSLDDVSVTAVDTDFTVTSSSVSINQITTGDGVTISANGSASISDAWNLSPFEDVAFTFSLDGGFTGNGLVNYIGNGDVGYLAADLDADGDIDADDFTLFASASNTVLSGSTPYDFYTQGDLDNDGDNDYNDFRLFKDAFIAANGAAAFAALSATTVPEPTAALLIALGLPLLCRRK